MKWISCRADPLRQRSHFRAAAARDNRSVLAANEVVMLRRIKLLIVLVVMLATGLGMMVVLIQIVPGKTDARLPLALTASGMVTAGLIAAGVLTRLAR